MKYDPDCGLSQSYLSGELIATLMEAGFREVDAHPRCKERVFERPRTKDGSIRVAVFTSIHKYKGVVRGRGFDAIRVCLLRKTKDGTDRGLVKVKRVNRVGEVSAICERTLERMRDCWASLKTVRPCNCCGAPMFVSKKGRAPSFNLVCSDLCFRDKPGYKPRKSYKKNDKYRGRRRYQ